MFKLLVIIAIGVTYWAISDLNAPLTAADAASIHAQAEDAREYLARREAAELDAAQRHADLVAKYRRSN